MIDIPIISQLPFFSKKKKSDSQAEEDLKAKRKMKIQKRIKEFSKGLVTIQDIIAPEAIEVDFTFQKINSTYTRTLFVAGYPRTVPANWLSPLINYPHQITTSMFVFPMESGEILDNLKRKITEMEAEIQSDIRSGKISNINTEVKLNDARNIREQLAKGSEHFYQFGLYITIKAKSVKELEKITKGVQSSLGALLIVSKKSTMQMDEGFKTTLPMGLDHLNVTRNMDTTSLATTFPFTSSELTMDTGIVYGINEHNDSLVIFDRFKMENANMLIFAKSGAGKSYTIKLEIFRQLMFDTEVIVLDPEHEYEELTNHVGGEYINFTFDGEAKINPFDLANLYTEGENELGQKIISLHGLLKVMLGEMTPQQEALLDKAIVAAYKAKGITPDPVTQSNEPPLMEDLYKALIGMESKESSDLAARLEKFITGSFRGIFDQRSNIDITNQFTVFSVKEMEEELRPIAMYVILDFIWTKVKKDFKKRLLVIDEAWYFMKHPDSASFIYSMSKRARKYFLGITTITQDIEDFLQSKYGKAIVSNSSIQFLMKQSPASLPTLTETFHLSAGERYLLSSADIGEGIFFAGSNHVALRVVASDEEHQVITTNPEELLERKNKKDSNLLKNMNGDNNYLGGNQGNKSRKKTTQQTDHQTQANQTQNNNQNQSQQTQQNSQTQNQNLNQVQQTPSSVTNQSPQNTTQVNDSSPNTAQDKNNNISAQNNQEVSQFNSSIENDQDLKEQQKRIKNQDIKLNRDNFISQRLQPKQPIKKPQTDRVQKPKIKDMPDPGIDDYKKPNN